MQLLKTSFATSDLFSFETGLGKDKKLQGFLAPPLDAMLVVIKRTFTPRTSLSALHARIRGHLMIQAKPCIGNSTVKLAVPCGVLDITSLPIFESLTHSFEEGNRHGTIEKKITTKEEMNANLGMVAFTVANPIKINPSELPENRPHIGVIKFGDGASHYLGFNPTARQFEATVQVSWFSSTGGYVGGVKRPDPPDDGVERIFDMFACEWLVAASAQMQGGASATELCRSANGQPEFQFM